MCGRYILVQKLEVIENRFQVSVKEPEKYKPSFNIGPGRTAAVITTSAPRELQFFTFGLTPFWAKKRMYLFNARSEGDRNKENDPGYRGAKDIINKPAFRKPIRSQRCLVIADAFVEGTTDAGLNKPYVVYLRNKERPFAMAGIWDQWEDPGSGEVVNSFAIVTTVSNSLLQQIPHHRSPVIIPRSYEKAWLREDAPLTDVTSILRPYNAELMNAYPIGSAIKDPRADSPDIIQPIGLPLVDEPEYKTKSYLELQGMGSGKNRLQDLK